MDKKTNRRMWRIWDLIIAKQTKLSGKEKKILNVITKKQKD